MRFIKKMKNRWIILIMAILSSVTLLTFQNCAKFKSNSEEDSFLSNVAKFEALPGEFYASINTLGPAATPVNSLQYYGYPFMRNESEMLPEVANHSNAFSVIYHPQDSSLDAGIRDMVGRARPDLKVIIFLDDVFHDPATQILWPDATIQNHLAKLRALVGSNLSNVLYFALDENALRFVTQYCRTFTTGADAVSACVMRHINGSTNPPAAVIDNARNFAQQVGVTLRGMFPGAGLALIESGPLIREVNPFPDNFDLYGFDCYQPFDNCFGQPSTPYPIPTIYRKMRNYIADMNQRLGGFRRLAIIPEATLSYDISSANPVAVSTGKNEAEAIRVFDQYFEMINNDPMVILVGPWIWQSFPESSVMWGGARGRPLLRAHVEAKGRAITGKPPVPWTEPPVIEFVSSPGLVGQKSTWFWSTTGASMCYSVSEPGIFPNLPVSGYMKGPLEAVARNVEYTIACRGPYGESRKTLRYVVTDPAGGGNGGNGGGGSAVAPIFNYASSNNLTFTRGQSGSASPVITDGAITSCNINPALPAGLSINASCVISGTATTVQAASTHTVTAINLVNGQSLSGNVSVRISVIEPASTLLRPNITYPQTTYSFTQNVAIGTIEVINSGGPIDNSNNDGCTASPALPTGISLSRSTCALSGTPTVAPSAASFTITAKNASGSSSKTINISVQVGTTPTQVPRISYSPSRITLNQGVAISANTPIRPTNSGDAISSCTSSPAMPSGLTVNSDCSITGTPNNAQGEISYTITARNGAGTGTAGISIAILSSLTAPNITYTPAAYEFTRGTVISRITPINSGGPINTNSPSYLGCTISPTLPSGLTFSSSDCSVSGTPTVAQAARNYTVTARNDVGSSIKDLSLAVVETVAAPNISFTNNPFLLNRDTTMHSSLGFASNSGGPIDSCSSSPTLPAGITISNSNCSLSGTPKAVTTIAVSYTISATGPGGTGRTVISIDVRPKKPSIRYSTPAPLVKDTTITSITPSYDGGDSPTSCTSSPALPAGLTLSNSCVISGRPTTNQNATNYTITATNRGGSDSTLVSLIVNTPRQLSCSVTRDQLASYSMSGIIVPDSLDAGLIGSFFVAGYDVVQSKWYSFDGQEWHEHTADLDSSFASISSLNYLFAAGITGPIFTDANLTRFPGALIFLGYGITRNAGSDQKIQAWNEMMASERYFLCDTLPAR